MLNEIIDKGLMFIRYLYNKSLSEKSYPKAIKRWFKSVTGYELDLDNPKTFDEKIQYLKLYDKNPLKTTLSDKYAVREWVSKTIGVKYLIPMLGAWDSFDEIDFSKLPDRFVLKANHASGWNMIVQDKSKLDINAARRKFNRWMKTDFAFIEGFELQYHDIKRKIVAEEFIENGGNNLFDYKFYCFNGKPEFIEYIGDRLTGQPKVLFLSTDWTPEVFTDGIYPEFKELPPKPACLAELNELAGKLSAGFPFVRVDLYVLDDGSIKFGEMTFTPGSGKHSHWNPPEYATIIGDMIPLPPKN
ncbi:MAG: glycosyltransferase [Lachnospiraceae bacterium]|nr:glycosyltransferase [Lachnospiraceae bacterium]